MNERIDTFSSIKEVKKLHYNQLKRLVKFSTISVMLLYEFEGLELFEKEGINVPRRELVSVEDSGQARMTISGSVVLKAQVLSGKRADAGGIVKIQDSGLKIQEELENLFKKSVNNEKVTRILVEEEIPYQRQDEYYLSFSYDTQTSGPILTFAASGGTGIEDRGASIFPINILEGVTKETISHPRGVIPQELVEVVIKAWQVFTKYDCELVEINPLVVVQGNASTSLSEYSLSEPKASRSDTTVYALDAKVILDDDADFRREIKFPERNLFGREPTEAEIEARKIDEGDHRGTAGSVYWDLDGDIAVLAAGGGGSVVNMDALIACGGKPANYTEHSGNPPREKLKKLTKIILSKSGLKGLWIVGGTANFTDIYETLAGVVEGLREVKPKPNFPIVIRRGGPRDKEAFEMLKEVAKNEGFDIHIFGRETPMTSTAKIMVELAYKSSH